MTEWQGSDDECAPIFVDTETSEDHEPRHSPGLFLFAALMTVALIGLLAFALGSTDGPGPASVTAPDAEPTPTSTTVEDLPADVVLDTGVIGVVGEARRAVTSDGEEFCLVAAGDLASRACSAISARPADRGVLTSEADTGHLWCAAIAASPTVTGVMADFSDGTSSRLELASRSDDPDQFAAVCRADGAGLVGLELLRNDFVMQRIGAPNAPLVEATVDPGPEVTLVAAPAGWHRARLGRFSFLSPAPILIDADPDPGLSRCKAAQFAVLSALADEAVLIAVTELDGAISLPERVPLSTISPTTPGSFDYCLHDSNRPLVRAAQFAESGRQLEVAVVDGGRAAPEDLARAVELADSIEVLPNQIAADSQSRRPPSVGAMGAAGAWTGDEFLLWGGEQPMLTSLFDPNVTGWVGTTGAAPEPYAITSSYSGARLDPETRVWRPMAPAPADVVGGRYGSVWTGDELMLWSTEGGDGSGLAYRPSDDTWRPLASPIVADEGSLFAPALLWTGDQVLLFGRLFGPYTARGEIVAATYSPTTDQWSPIPIPSDAVPVPVFDAIWTGTEAVSFVDPGRGVAYNPTTTTWRSFRGPVDASGEAVDPQRVVWDGEHLHVMSLEVADDDRVATLYSARAPFDRWETDDFPPTTVLRIDTVLALDDGLLAIGPVVDSTTYAPRPPIGYYRRAVDGETTPVPVPSDWSRCDSTIVAMPGEVLFWGGTDCATSRFVVADDTIATVSLPGQ